MISTNSIFLSRRRSGCSENEKPCLILTNECTSFRSFKTGSRDYMKLLVKDNPISNLKLNGLETPTTEKGSPSHEKKTDEFLFKKASEYTRHSIAKPKALESLKVESFHTFASCNQTNPTNNNTVATKVPYSCIITVDTSKARSNSEVLKLCIAELGWQECPDGLASGCDIIWQSCTSHEGRDQFTNISQSALSRINKFPCKIKISE